MDSQNTLALPKILLFSARPMKSSEAWVITCARVAVVRQHGGDGPCAGAPARVNHHQQLHQVVVDGGTRWLDQEHITPTDGFLQHPDVSCLALRRVISGVTL